MSPKAQQDQDFPHVKDTNSSTEDEESIEQQIRSWGMEPQENDERPGRYQRVCCLVKFVFLPLVALAVLSALLVHFLGGESGSPFNLDLDLFRSEDPTDGQTYQWRHATSGQGGLELPLINALDPSWHSYFDVAVQQWNNGNPDALALTSTVREPDSECSPLSGYLKICNADYGNIHWKGLNKMYMQNGYIYQSVGMMNDHFHNPRKENLKQYTMCHEIGHGFGLPHTDERFWNFNQGNCMDYTTRPGSNKQPSETNFKTLSEMYGIIGETASSTQSNNQNFRPRPETEEEKEKEDKEDKEDKDDRNRRVLQAEIPDWVVQANKDMDALIERGEVSNHAGFRKLHESEFGLAHEIDLGEGYTIQMHYLLA